MKLLTFITTFIIIVLVELGDKTQVATLLYSSNHPEKRWQVFLAAAAALVTCVSLEVTAGVVIARIISPALINKLTGAIFIIMGGLIIRSLVKEVKAPGAQFQDTVPNQSGQFIKPGVFRKL